MQVQRGFESPPLRFKEIDVSEVPCRQLVTSIGDEVEFRLGQELGQTGLVFVAIW